MVLVCNGIMVQVCNGVMVLVCNGVMVSGTIPRSMNRCLSDSERLCIPSVSHVW
jgi:hypothetical protein